MSWLISFYGAPNYIDESEERFDMNFRVKDRDPGRSQGGRKCSPFSRSYVACYLEKDSLDLPAVLHTTQSLEDLAKSSSSSRFCIIEKFDAYFMYLELYHKPHPR